MGGRVLAEIPSPGEYRVPKRDTELCQTLLGLTAPWEVTAVDMTQPSASRLRGEVVVTVRRRPDNPVTCPGCGYVAPRYDSRPRRRRHLNPMQWKTFITADVPRVHCPQGGVKHARDGLKACRITAIAEQMMSLVDSDFASFFGEAVAST